MERGTAGVKSIYLRNFTAMAVLVFFCLMLICLSFIGIGRMQLVRVLRGDMIASAREVSRIASAIEQNVQGQVLVSFIVEQDGSVTDVRVEHGIDERLDDEAVRVVSVSPKWIPGQIKGRKVRTRIVIPVEFRLKK